MKLISALLVVVLLGCSSYRQEFVTVVDDHYVITQETVIRLNKSIDEALALPIQDSERQDLLNLKSRLEYMGNSSAVIRKYVYAQHVDEALLKELVQNSWK